MEGGGGESLNLNMRKHFHCSISLCALFGNCVKDLVSTVIFVIRKQNVTLDNSLIDAVLYEILYHFIVAIL